MNVIQQTNYIIKHQNKDKYVFNKKDVNKHLNINIETVLMKMINYVQLLAKCKILNIFMIKKNYIVLKNNIVETQVSISYIYGIEILINVLVMKHV